MGLFSSNIDKLQAKKNVRKLVKILLHDKVDDRKIKAANALGSIGDAKAVEPLIDSLKGSSSRVIVAATEALGDIGDSDSVPPLIKSLRSIEEDEVIAAITALGKIGTLAAKNGLTSLIDHRIPAIREKAVEALGELRSPECLQTFDKLLWSGDTDLKKTAVISIGKIGDAEAVRLLKNAFQAGDIEIREEAAKALARLGLKPDTEKADQWTESSGDELLERLPLKLRELLTQKGDLPAIPEIVIKLNKMLMDQDAELKGIANLVKTDAPLAARVVKVANSAYFARGAVDITDIQTAVSRLGLNQMRNIVFAFSILKQFDKARLIDKRKFWTHSFVTAQVAQALLKRTGIIPEIYETAYMAGLMHDIGITVMIYLIPEAYERFLRGIIGDKRDMPHFSLINEEDESFGITHPVIGAAYVQHWWPVDQEIVDAILHHHEKVDQINISQISKAVMLANLYCHSIELDNGINCQLQPPPFDYELLKEIGMDESGIDSFKAEVDGEVEAAEMILSFA